MAMEEPGVMLKVQLKNSSGDDLLPHTSMAHLIKSSAGGIRFTGNTITTSAIPQANITGLTTALAGKQNTLSAGFATIVSGATVGQARYFKLQSDITGGTVTLSAGFGYRIYANGAAVTLAAETFTAGQFGLEGHAEIYVTNLGYVRTTSNVVIGTPLTSNAYNNCTLRFHDGHCIIDVEDITAP